jgi:hypothetical protein
MSTIEAEDYVKRAEECLRVAGGGCSLGKLPAEVRQGSLRGGNRISRRGIS